MTSQTSVQAGLQAYPEIDTEVRQKLLAAGHAPDDFIPTLFFVGRGLIEASYYPRIIAREHEQGNYSVPNYHWVAVTATLAPGGNIAWSHVKLLEAGGWME